MSESPEVGSLGWLDLTVPNATEIRDFYSQVVGWQTEDIDMGEYNDFNMTLEDGTPVGGVCHARGPNEGLPAVWMPYIHVEDLDASLVRCQELGGKLIGEPRSAGGDTRYCMIQDPSGAYISLFQAS